MKFLKKYSTQLITILVLVFFGFYLKRNIDVILSTFNTTTANLTRYFFVALGLVIVSFYFFVKSYQLVFKMNGLKRSLWDLFKLNFAAMAVNVIVPTAGLSSAMVYAEDAKRRGESQASTISAVIITYISNYTSISIFLLLSLIYLWIIDSIVPHVVIPAVVFFLLTAGTYLLAFSAGRESKILEKIIKFSLRVVQKPFQFILKREIKIEESVHKLYEEFKSVNKAILEDPKDWLLTILYASLYHLFAIFAIYVIFLSFGVDPLIRVILAAYSVAAMFMVVSPTPSGIGFVEGGFYLIYTALGIPGAIATTATLIFRSLTFWIPLFFGFFIYQKNKIKDIIQKSDVLS